MSGDRERLRAAFSLHQAGRFVEARIAYRQIPKRHPDYAVALHYLGALEASLGNLQEACSLIVRSLEIQPSNIQCLENYATILYQSGDYASALQTCDKGLRLSSVNVALRYISAVALYKLKRFDDSLSQFDKLLSIQPRHLAGINERGSLLAEMGRYEAASAAFQEALKLAPKYAEAHLNCGNLFGKLHRFDEALSAYDRALALKPELADAWIGRGNAFTDLNRYDEAFAAYDKALAFKPDLAEGWLGRGYVFTGLKRYDEALGAYDKALAFKPDLAEGWLGRGNVFTGLKRYNEAFSAYDRALALKPGLNYAAAARMHAKLHLCDWTNLKAEAVELISISREQVASAPFSLLALPSSPSDLLQCTRRYVKDQPRFPPLWRGETYSHDRIRIAYLSADFGEHPVAYLTVGLFEQHDKSQFEVTGISFGSHHSPIRERMKSAFERFIEVDDKTDKDIAELVRRSEIDIAVDLMGHTQHNRFSVFARRPAPIQVNYLGYLGTLGAKFIDYVIADKIALPFDQQPYFDEKIIHLPDCFLVTDDRQEIASWNPSRQEVGLPADGFVFCCFNNSYKLARPLFEAWMRVLRAVPNSVLWLAQSNDQMIANLRGEAERCHVDPARLVFAPRLPLPQHLARQHLAGLFLDTVPYNAGATAVAALWAGVPVLTIRGDTFVGRMAASMLHAIGLPELMTHNLEDYEALAVKLAREPILLDGLRRRLGENQSLLPLFDTDRFRGSLERAYTTMIEIERQGKGPRSFSVECG
jgi:protein O-GlcNAc transferase